MSSQDRRAFTIVELLVVVIILAIVIALLLPAEALGFFITAMMLMPEVNAAAGRFWVFGRSAQPLPA
jgi:prepilin-type N-terminal cleavage/methylation domain-containing protein